MADMHTKQMDGHKMISSFIIIFITCRYSLLAVTYLWVVRGCHGPKNIVAPKIGYI